METRNLKLGIDLITLYDPAFWGIDDFNRFYDDTVLLPEQFWDRALDTLEASGVQGVELTFGPGHWKNAVAHYGSPAAFREALTARSLEVCSGFYTGLVLKGDWRLPARQEEIVEEVAAYADFLTACGCDVMIAGLPLRTSWDADPPLFIDLSYAAPLADLLNRIGYVAATRGVRLAIHPETHAVLWLRRDIDLFLSLTDPVYVGFCPDTAHITTGGGDPCDIVRAHASRVVITHWKDAKGRVPVRVPIDENTFKSHHPFFTHVGAGEVDWQRWMRTLRDVRYEGWAIIELDAAPDPPRTIEAARTFVETALLPIYA